MKLRLISALLAATLLAGCPMDRKDPKNKAKGRYDTDKPPVPTKDESGDVAFQSFVGRLRTAVENRDLITLTSMMSQNFGYRWDEAPNGEDAFTYWNKHQLWGVLAGLLGQKWVPYDGFMVVPPALAEQPDYGGYRAGLQIVNGSWRFAYFVPAPPVEVAAPSPAPTSL